MKPRGRRKPRAIPEVLTPEEQTRLLGRLEPTDCPGKLRNLALVRVMLNSGLRASEARAVKVRDIDWNSGRLKVRGKGGKDRVIWLAGNDLILLKNWLDHKPSSTRMPSSTLVFTSLDGTKPLCGRWLRKLVTRLATQAGIDKRIHPHTLRHTFATNLLRQEKNLFTVMKALGHANLSTTQIYLHLEDEELETAMKKLGNGKQNDFQTV
mgnify:CR=1 FL=1